MMSLNVTLNAANVFNVLKDPHSECEIFTLTQHYVLLNEMAIT